MGAFCSTVSGGSVQRVAPMDMGTRQICVIEARHSPILDMHEALPPESILTKAFRVGRARRYMAVACGWGWVDG